MFSKIKNSSGDKRKRTSDLVKEICKQLLDSITQQTENILWQWVAFQLYNTTHHISSWQTCIPIRRFLAILTEIKK